MKKQIVLLLTITATLMLLSTSCVSTKKYNTLASRSKDESLKLNAKIDQLTTDLNELKTNYNKLRSTSQAMAADTSRLAAKVRVITADYDELSNEYDFLKSQLEGNQDETQQILANLKKSQEDLIAREDKLRIMQSELDLKNKDLIELQSALRRNDSITQALRKSVADALTGFEGKGLTVHMKDGKVYVSLEEKLLFASGKWEVSAEGENALINLAKVLERNPDINVLIEGHTDNVPLNGQNQVKDNWDLSVMRATAIVKILLDNGTIDPKRLVASGRGEFIPVDSNGSAAGRAKNRRTEIILSPKLDELIKVMGQN